MRRILLLLALSPIVFEVGIVAPARGAEPARVQAAEPSARPRRVRYYHTTRYARPQPKSWWDRLMDLERRKNAWIRKNILGR